jgi:hypothetical protein
MQIICSTRHLGKYALPYAKWQLTCNKENNGRQKEHPFGKRVSGLTALRTWGCVRTLELQTIGESARPGSEVICIILT